MIARDVCHCPNTKLRIANLGRQRMKISPKKSLKKQEDAYSIHIIPMFRHMQAT
jgi:hypothetical protein